MKDTFQQQTQIRRKPEFGIIKWLRKALRQGPLTYLNMIIPLLKAEIAIPVLFLNNEF